MATEITSDPNAESGARRRLTPLELDGVTYLLTYDFEAVVTAEEATGIALLVGVNWTNVGVKRIRAMLYASMLAEQPKITLEEITRLINFNNILKIEEALVLAWRSPTPEPEAVKQPAEAELQTEETAAA
jgi:hypothetical protein